MLFLQQAVLLRQGVKATLPNTQKQTQGSCQIKEKRNTAQMKVQDKTPVKELKGTEITNLSDAEFKTLVIRILKELIEYGNSIKNTQAEMKVTFSEIKKNLQGTISGGEEARIQINNLEHKKHATRTTRRKNNFKKNKDRPWLVWLSGLSANPQTRRSLV